MTYNSENIERLKRLSEEISLKEVSERETIVLALEKIYVMLDRAKINKVAIKQELKTLIEKIA